MVGNCDGDCSNGCEENLYDDKDDMHCGQCNIYCVGGKHCRRISYDDYQCQ